MISIIIPIYNAEDYIGDCLESIRQQTYKDFEVICVNDGSPDKSAIICQKYADIDNRFILINQKNGGVCSARNTGLSKANGEYICFIDSDDAIEPHYLAELYNLSADGSMAICSYTRETNKLTEKTTKILTFDAHDYIRHVFDEDIEHPNICMMLFKYNIIQKYNLNFHVGCIRNEDTEFYIKYMVHEKKIVFSDYKGYFYRINPCSVMNTGINMKSLTSIEAQERISDYLVRYNIYPADNCILSASVQSYIFISAKNRKEDIYNYLHAKYPVRSYIRKMLNHPRAGRKMMSVCYLVLGRKLFYLLLSKL